MANELVAGALAVEVYAKRDRLNDDLKKAEEDVKKGKERIERNYANIKATMDDRLLKLKLTDVEKLHTKLKQRLEEKIQLKFDDASIERTKTQLKSVEDALKKINTPDQTTANKLSQLDDFLKGSIGISLKGIGIGAIVTGLGAVTIDAVKAYTEVEGVYNAFEKLNNPDLLNKLRSATRNTIADAELMKLTMQAVDSNISFDNLEQILELAKNKASDTGMSFEYLAKNIIDDIGNESTSALEKFGVSVNEMEDEISRVGTYGEAAFNLVSKSITNMGFVAETNKDKIAQISAAIQNVKEQFGGFVFDSINFLIKYSSTSNVANAELQEAYQKVMNEFAEKQKQLDKAVKSAQKQSIENTKGKDESELVNYIKTVQEKINEIGEAKSDEEKLKLEQLNAKLNVYKRAHEDLAPLFDPYSKKLSEVQDKIKTLNELKKEFSVSDNQYKKLIVKLRD
ncbi:MAG: hypothetical protein IPM32_18260 [Ignavibacteriae bacterium]|nr:hypothetical protein [Ignavibacteriota bacterium]